MLFRSRSVRLESWFTSFRLSLCGLLNIRFVERTVQKGCVLARMARSRLCDGLQGFLLFWTPIDANGIVIGGAAWKRVAVAFYSFRRLSPLFCLWASLGRARNSSHASACPVLDGSIFSGVVAPFKLSSTCRGRPSYGSTRFFVIEICFWRSNTPTPLLPFRGGRQKNKADNSRVGEHFRLCSRDDPFIDV